MTCKWSPIDHAARNMQMQAHQGARTCSSSWSMCGRAPWIWMPNAEEHTPRVPVDEHGAGDGCFTHGRGEPPCPKAFIWLVKVIDNCWEGTVRYLLPW